MGAGDDLERAVTAEMEGLGAVESSEVERAVAVTETRLALGIQQVGDRADLLSMYGLLFGDPGQLNREIDLLRAVSVGELQRFAETFLGADNRAVLTYIPGEES